MDVTHASAFRACQFLHLEAQTGANRVLSFTLNHHDTDGQYSKGVDGGVNAVSIGPSLRLAFPSLTWGNSPGKKGAVGGCYQALHHWPSPPLLQKDRLQAKSCTMSTLKAWLFLHRSERVKKPLCQYLGALAKKELTKANRLEQVWLRLVLQFGTFDSAQVGTSNVRFSFSFFSPFPFPNSRLVFKRKQSFLRSAVRIDWASLRTLQLRLPLIDLDLVADTPQDGK